MYGSDHPPGFGSQHPWRDLFAPEDIFASRPDPELAIVGPLAPRAEDYPFTDEGRREHSAAVRSAAQQQTMQQHQAMDHQMAMRQHAAHVEARARALREHLSLLRR